MNEPGEMEWTRFRHPGLEVDPWKPSVMGLCHEHFFDVSQPLLNGLQVAGIFFYKALSSIFFGVAVTTAIEGFVDKEQMARFLGGRDLKTMGVVTATGAASSACTVGTVNRCKRG